MRCPACGAKLDYVIGTQVVHYSVKVDEWGHYIDNVDDFGDAESPCGDWQCPECDEYFSSLHDFREE